MNRSEENMNAYEFFSTFKNKTEIWRTDMYRRR